MSGLPGQSEIALPVPPHPSGPRRDIGVSGNGTSPSTRIELEGRPDGMWRAASPPMGISGWSPRRNHCPKGASNWGSARRRRATSKSPSDAGLRLSRAASSRWSRLLGSARSLVPIKEIGFYKSLPFDIQRPTWLEAEHVAQCLAGRGGDMNAAGQAVALHALCGVHGIAPDVVDEFVRA